MLKPVIKNRERTGPTPYSVAIIARPTNKRPVDYLILERRRIEELRDRSIADSKHNKQCDLRSSWVSATNEKIEKTCITREVKKCMQEEETALEKRREQLREMLYLEEEGFMREMESMEETVEFRQEKMKERAKYLKEKHEAERLAYVQEKLDDKFRDECEELRGEFSRQTRDEVFRDREAQIQMKNERLQRENDIETFYANLWQLDVKAKETREEQEKKERFSRARETIEVLDLQQKVLEEKKEEENLVKEIESEWLKEESLLRDNEEKQILQEKAEKHRRARRARDVSTKLKNKREARGKQEDLAMDMKSLEQTSLDAEDEVTKNINRKIQKRDEMKTYMHYVSKTRQDEEDQEKRLEKLINEETEELWREKSARIALEKESRKMLMENVLREREKQIKERGQIMRKEQEVIQRERLELQEQLETHRKMESERISSIRKENEKHHSDIEQQIEYQRKIMEQEIDNARKEFELSKLAEEAYQQRLQSNIHKTPKKIHPRRLMGKVAS